MQSSLLRTISSFCDDKRYSDLADLISSHFNLDVEAKVYLERFIVSLQKGSADIAPLVGVANFEPSELALLKWRFSEKTPSNLARNLDYLGGGVPENLATILTHVANRLVPKRGFAALVTSVRNEGPWLLEWIAHHKALGFGLIIVVYNDSDDGTNEILEHLSQRREIIAIRNEVTASVSPQKKAFNAALHLVEEIHSFEWVSFLDADEFVTSVDVSDVSISKIVADVETRSKAASADRVDAILLHWRWFASPLQYEWVDGPVVKRFQLSTANDHVKSIARVSKVWSMSRLHVPTLIQPGLVVNSAGHSVGLSEQLSPPLYETAQINHYFAKSFQEFALKKSRGRGALGATGPQRDFENFLWGAHQLIPTETKGFDRTLMMLRSFLDDPAISALQSDSEKRSRQKIRSLESELDLRVLYENITTYVKSKS
jgi:hypothetical protein